MPGSDVTDVRRAASDRVSVARDQIQPSPANPLRHMRGRHRHSIGRRLDGRRRRHTGSSIAGEGSRADWIFGDDTVTVAKGPVSRSFAISQISAGGGICGFPYVALMNSIVLGEVASNAVAGGPGLAPCETRCFSDHISARDRMEMDPPGQAVLPNMSCATLMHASRSPDGRSGQGVIRSTKGS